MTQFHTNNMSIIIMAALWGSTKTGIENEEKENLFLA